MKHYLLPLNYRSGWHDWKGGLLLPCYKKECLQRLESLISNQTFHYNETNSLKILVDCYRHSWLHRAVHLYRVMFELQKSPSIVALTIARPFLEHVIVFIEYMRIIKNNDAKNCEQIRSLLLSLGEKTKNKEFLESQESTTAEQTNIKTILEKITEKPKVRLFFENYFKEEIDNLQSQYDVLSEYIHPSSLSTIHHFSNINPANKKIELYKDGSQETIEEFQKCLEYILVFENAYKDSEKIFNDAIRSIK